MIHSGARHPTTDYTSQYTGMPVSVEYSHLIQIVVGHDLVPSIIL